MSGIKFQLSTTESLQRFREYAEGLLEGAGELTEGIREKLEAKARVLGVHKVDYDKILVEVVEVCKVEQRQREKEGIEERLRQREGEHRLEESQPIDDRLVDSEADVLGEINPELYVPMGHTDYVKSVAITPDGRYAISGSKDGTLKLWDIQTGEEVVKFIGFSDGEWVVVTPEGYFTASNDAVKYLSVRVGNEIHDIKKYCSRFYKPEIIKERLNKR